MSNKLPENAHAAGHRAFEYAGLDNASQNPDSREEGRKVRSWLMN